MKKQNMKLKTKEILKRIGTKKVYVAYGSNLDIGMMERRCPDAEVVGTGILHGWELEFRDYASIREDEKKSTPVLVWAVSASDEKALDRYESYPELYRKEDVRFSVWDEDGNELQGEGMAYVMNFKGGLREPSPLYYAIIEKAYRDLGLPAHVLKDALKRSRNDGWQAGGRRDCSGCRKTEGNGREQQRTAGNSKEQEKRGGTNGQNEIPGQGHS